MSCWTCGLNVSLWKRDFSSSQMAKIRRRAKMNAIIYHFSLEFLAGLRNRTLLLMNYLMPLGFYALMGAMMTKINPPFAQQIIPAMVVFATLSSAILGLPGPLVEARESEILRSYRI